MKILVTGASGFVGKALCNALIAHGHLVRGVYRNNKKVNPNIESVFIDDINGDTNWDDALKEIDVVIHLAARAHVLSEAETNPLEVFRKINTEGTLRFATGAAKLGVKRFVFISSIGVNGYTNSQPFTEESDVKPTEHYAISKLEAEQGLKLIAERSGMDVVIVRPPLVYGNCCSGNFMKLLEVIYKGWPLPFGVISNKRSLIHVENLSDFLALCAAHPLAANQLFLIADEPDISTPSIITHLAKGMNHPVRLFSAPYQLINLLAKLVGKQMALKKLCGDLQIDSSFARNTLGWHQPISLLDGLQKVGKHFVENKKLIK